MGEREIVGTASHTMTRDAAFRLAFKRTGGILPREAGTRKLFRDRRTRALDRLRELLDRCRG